MPSVENQPVDARLSRAAIFIVLSVHEGEQALAAVRGLFGDLGSLVRAVGFRDFDARLNCVLGIGSGLWDRLGQPSKPAGLHPFREVTGIHTAPSTPGDILLHIRAERPDFCFELATHIMSRIGGAVTVEDETTGFRFFDNRDLLGFVDGTENPEGTAVDEALLIGGEDADFAGGSYVVTQKYIHDMAAWNRLPVEQQERIIGRRKLSDIEFPDAEKAPYAHNVLTSIEDENGEDLEILRDNMPFGSPAKGEFGTYFIGYARDPDRIERMLDNMFIGDPPGTYDRLLDVSTAVTGGLFFVPPADMLEAMADPPADAPAPPEDDTDTPAATGPDGSLGIGSLKRSS